MAEQEKKQEKPGYKTTEFWLSLLVIILGALMASGALGEQHWAVKMAGLGLDLLATMGYTAARAKTKLGSSLERVEESKAALNSANPT